MSRFIRYPEGPFQAWHIVDKIVFWFALFLCVVLVLGVVVGMTAALIGNLMRG